jgi:6-pyruvoyl-tetrahydropterin synthase
MFIITEAFSFCAAHRLVGMGEGHPQGRLHGHNWGVEVSFHVELLDEGGVASLDTPDVGLIREHIRDTYDHRTILNADDPLVEAIHSSEGENACMVLAIKANPTAEIIATNIYWSLVPLGYSNVASVRVCEVPGRWVEARMEPE